MPLIAEIALFDEEFEGSGDRFSAAMSLAPALGRARGRIFSAGTASQQPARGAEVDLDLRAHAELWEHLVLRVFTLLARYTGGPRDLAEAPAAVLAAGDLGRREFFPHSDLELIVLTRGTDRAEPSVDALRALPAFLESAGLRATVSVRTLERCDEELLRDLSGTAELLEARFLAGDEQLLRAFRRRLVCYLGDHGREHLAERVGAERERADFRGGFRAVRTPDLMLSPGGLRDVHALFALDRLGRAVLTGPPATMAPWEQRGRASHLAAVSAAQVRLVAARRALHLAAGARKDILELEHWPALADRLPEAVVCNPGRAAASGEAGSGAAAEPVVQALQLQCRIVFERLERLLYELSWRMSQGDSRTGDLTGPGQTGGLSVRAGRLAPSSDDLFKQEPGRLLQVQLLSERMSCELADGLILLSRRDAGSLAELMRADPRQQDRLRELFRLSGRTGARLRELDRAGVLSAAFPEFRALQCRLRADGPELQALDQHAFQAVEVIDALERGEGDSNCAGLVSVLDRRELLKIALFFHDIQSSDGNHRGTRRCSALIRVLERIGLDESEMRTVRFLIEEQHSMIRLSLRSEDRRRAEVEQLVERSGGTELLRRLYLFSVADTLAGDRGAWSRWDLGLLESLLRQTGAWSASLPVSMNTLSRSERPPTQRPPTR